MGGCLQLIEKLHIIKLEDDEAEKNPVQEEEQSTDSKHEDEDMAKHRMRTGANDIRNLALDYEDDLDDEDEDEDEDEDDIAVYTILDEFDHAKMFCQAIQVLNCKYPDNFKQMAQKLPQKEQSLLQQLMSTGTLPLVKLPANK